MSHFEEILVSENQNVMIRHMIIIQSYWVIRLEVYHYELFLDFL